MLRVFLLIVAFGLLVIAYSAIIERNWFALRKHRVPCLPPGSQPVTLLHISDLHYRNNLKVMRRFLRKLSRLDPDIVVGTGDFLGDDDASEQCAKDLAAITGSLATVFVLGSNDYYKPIRKNPINYLRKPKRGEYKHGPTNTWEDLVSRLQGSGWRLLLNQKMHVDGIEIVGLDDPHIRRHDMDMAPHRRSGDIGVRICAVHSPEIAHELAERGFDLIVCGHTHGGQLRVPGYGALVTNAGDLPRAMARGLHQIGSSWLHVSAGLGTSKFTPVRFACRPEACLLELVPRNP